MRNFAGRGGEDLLIPVVESGEAVRHLYQPQDAIAPISIEHDCDQAFDEEGLLEYEYNHLVYTFEIAGQTISARSYLDSIREVSLIGLPEGLDLSCEGMQLIMHYLSRRYQVIRGPGAKGQETIWQSGSASGER
ncbi:MAG: hypothetical protein F9K44_09720 [Hyphomicrobiaceae bacterium]|nr:MAG: hypothetical protein F9K44_09720 [Hyphomicrobiaceae bacterium]